MSNWLVEMLTMNEWSLLPNVNFKLKKIKLRDDQQITNRNFYCVFWIPLNILIIFQRTSDDLQSLVSAHYLNDPIAYHYRLLPQIFSSTKNSSLSCHPIHTIHQCKHQKKNFLVSIICKYASIKKSFWGKMSVYISILLPRDNSI